MNISIINEGAIKLKEAEITIQELKNALDSTNYKLTKIKNSPTGINIFNVIDFRALSGMIGELFAKELSEQVKKVTKNPYLNGYPDLLEISTSELLDYFKNCETKDFVRYKHGGIEVKNSFGTKKNKSQLLNGDQRIESINKKIDWKAHHRETNFLIGLLSDYIDYVPQIVALFYSDELIEDDWNKVQKPKGDSAMTSFSSISNSGYKKMINGVRLCYNNPTYLSYINIVQCQ